ncbi:MAG TPA: HAD family phosphatase [Vicinamibacteria bacterium]|nr:HAD family phosphatase [Vicinamibacteria bacterium]
MALRAAVFDFDGVIVDSEPLHFRSLRDALMSENVEISHEEYWDHLLAHDDRSSIRLAFERRGERPDPDRLARVERFKVERFAELIPEVPVFPGAREVIGALAAELPLAIASGARHDEIEAILAGIGLRDAFAALVGAEDAARTKPDPAPYLEAARRLESRVPGLVPAQCVAFEDSLPGVLSALGAGMKVVGVAHSYPAERLRSAHRVLDSLAAFEPASLGGLFED